MGPGAGYAAQEVNRLNQQRTVQLPEDLCADAEKWLQGRFENIETLLKFLLQEIVRGESSKLDQREEEIVQQRLRDLGYL